MIPILSVDNRPSGFNYTFLYWRQTGRLHGSTKFRSYDKATDFYENWAEGVQP